MKPTFFWSTPMHCVLPQVRKICCMYMEISRHLVTANKHFFPLNHKCIAMANGLSYFSAGDLGGSAERTTKSQRGNYWRLDYTFKKTFNFAPVSATLCTYCVSLCFHSLYSGASEEKHIVLLSVRCNGGMRWVELTEVR